MQPLFDGGCVAGCHDARSFAGGFSLASGASAEHLLGVRSIEEPGLARVKPSDPASSYLLRKLLGTPDIAHQRMPIGEPWPADRIRTVSDWILTGAQP